MNYKHLILIALALCLCFAVAPVAAVGKYYENKYVATDNTPYTDGCGQLVITTMDKNALIGSEFNLTRVDVGNFTFVNGQRIQKEQFDALTPMAPPVELTLDHNGNWDDRISPGTFSVFLKDGNGGQPEYALVKITEGYSNTVVFQGHAVGSGGVHKIIYTIIKATYGATREDCTTNLVVGSGHNDWWYITHGYELQYRYRTGTESHHQCNYGEWSDWMNVLPRSLTHGCYDQQTRWVKEVTTCTNYGQNLDVTQNVQSVVDKGYTSFFFFDNAQNPGGIFSQGNVLLSQISDPAYGIVKNVYIHYTKDGVDKTINTMEYESIAL